MISNCEIKVFCKHCAKGSIGKKKVAMAQNRKGVEGERDKGKVVQQGNKIYGRAAGAPEKIGSEDRAHAL